MKSFCLQLLFYEFRRISLPYLCFVAAQSGSKPKTRNLMLFKTYEIFADEKSIWEQKRYMLKT